VQPAITISNKDFFLYLRQYLAGTEGPLSDAQAEHVCRLCTLARSKPNWQRGCGSTRIVEVTTFATLILKGHDAEAMTQEIIDSQANVRFGTSEDPAGFDTSFAEVEQRIAELETSDHPQATMLERASGRRKGGPALRLVLVNRALVDDPQVRVLRGVETIIVRDDLGRKLDVAGLALGKVASGLGFFHVEGEPVADDIVTSKAPLAADKTYLVVVVEHSDDIDTEE
jgi:hypothetical protein